MKGVTERQLELLEYIRSYVEENRYAPSYRNIMAHLGLKSTATIHKHIQALKRKGLLSNEKSCGRSLALTESTPTSQAPFELPHVGFVSKRGQIEMLAEPASRACPPDLVQDASISYLLTVKDDAFVDEAILSSDMLIVEARSDADNGELVIATLSTGDIIIRKIYWQDSHVRLESRRPASQPLALLASNLTIHGVVKGLLRAMN